MKGDLNIDFVIAIVLFVSVYAMLYSVLPSATLGFRESPDPVAAASYYFSDMLVTTPGIPSNWSTVSQMTSLGLAFGSNATSYPNILDAKKVGAIDGQSCSAMKPKSGVTLDFAIIVESASKNYSCSAAVPRIARLIERICYLKNNTDYIPIKVKVWTW